MLRDRWEIGIYAAAFTVAWVVVYALDLVPVEHSTVYFVAFAAILLGAGIYLYRRKLKQRPTPPS